MVAAINSSGPQGTIPSADVGRKTVRVEGGGAVICLLRKTYFGFCRCCLGGNCASVCTL